MSEFRIDIGDATEKLLKGFENLSENKLKLSIMRSINSALGKTQTQVIRAVMARYNLDREKFVKQLNEKPYRATPSSPFYGHLFYYNKQYSLSVFEPREINQGVATSRIGEKKNVRGLYVGRGETRKLIQTGVVVSIIKGQTKVIPSAYLAFRGNRTTAGVSARGQYSSGFQFDQDKAAKTLRTVSVRSILQNTDVQKIMKETAQTEYSSILYKELQKRIKGIGERNSRL